MHDHEIKFLINGQPVCVSIAQPTLALVQYLRQDCALPGTKEVATFSPRQCGPKPLASALRTIVRICTCRRCHRCGRRCRGGGNALYVAVGRGTIAHGRLKAMRLARVGAAHGVVAVLTHADIPGETIIGPVKHDEPVFSIDRIEYFGQPLFGLVATSLDLARRAARLAELDHEEEVPILDYDDAIRADSHGLPPLTPETGDARAAIAQAPRRLANRLHIGGREQFYLEGGFVQGMGRLTTKDAPAAPERIRFAGQPRTAP